MPDARSGYGLPMGSVLSTDNAVIPYGVGMANIGCGYCLSIFDINPKDLTDRESFFARELGEATPCLEVVLGLIVAYTRYEVMENDLFYQLPC